MYMSVVSVSFHRHVYVRCFCVVPSSCICPLFRGGSIIMYVTICPSFHRHVIASIVSLSCHRHIRCFRFVPTSFILHVVSLSFVRAVASSPRPTTHRRHVRPWPRSSLLIQQRAFYIAALSYSRAPHGHNSARPSASVVWLISSPSIISRSAVR